MKVKELIAILEHNKQLHDLDIRMSSDSEGNGFGTLEQDGITFEDDKCYFFPNEDHLEYGE